MATSSGGGAASDATAHIVNGGFVSNGNGNGSLNGIAAAARDRAGGDDNSGGGVDEGEPWEKVENRRRQIKNGKRPMQFGGNGGQGRYTGSTYFQPGRVNFIGRQNGPSIHVTGGNSRHNFVNNSKVHVGQGHNFVNNSKVHVGQGKDSSGYQNLNNKGTSAAPFGKGSINCTPKTFKETLIGQTSVNSTAKYYKPESNGTDTYAKVNKIARINNEKKWKNAIYLYVVGKRPYFLHLKAFIERTWGLKGAIEIFSRENGFYLVKFDLEEDLLKVIDGGPWMFDGKPMIIKKWETNLKLDRDLLLTLPIWVRFPHLNLSLWDEENICRLASVVGRPIRMDEPTRKATRLNYARILIDMDTESTEKKVIKALTEDGETYMQEVEFEYIPPCCEQCKCFGHFKNICPLMVRCTKCLGFGHETETCSMIWVPVTKSPIDASVNSKKDGVPFAENSAGIANDPIDPIDAIPVDPIDPIDASPVDPIDPIPVDPIDPIVPNMPTIDPIDADDVTVINESPVSKACAKVAENLPNSNPKCNVDVHSGDPATFSPPIMNNSADLAKANEEPLNINERDEPIGIDGDNSTQCKSIEDISMADIFHDLTADINAAEKQSEQAITFEQINDILECMQVKIREKQDTGKQSSMVPVADHLKAQTEHASASELHHLNLPKDVCVGSLSFSDSADLHIEEDAHTEAIHHQSSGVPSPPKASVLSKEPAEQPIVHQESVAQIPLSKTSILSSQNFLSSTVLSSNLLHSTSNITDINNSNNNMNSTVQVLEPHGGQDVASRDEYDKSQGNKEHDEITFILQNYQHKDKMRDLTRVCISTCIWAIWKERNARIFKGISKSNSQICSEIIELTKIRLTMSKKPLPVNHDQIKTIMDWNLP